jgi:hypothetical protein
MLSDFATLLWQNTTKRMPTPDLVLLQQLNLDDEMSKTCMMYEEKMHKKSRLKASKRVTLYSTVHIKAF